VGYSSGTLEELEWQRLTMHFPSISMPPTKRYFRNERPLMTDELLMQRGILSKLVNQKIRDLEEHN
jgi:hypothetical protein